MPNFSMNFSEKDFPIGIPHPEFLAKLQHARDRYGKPIRISSGGRSPERNSSIGGVEGSAHVMDKHGYFRGVDIECSNSTERFYLVRELLAVGFHRLGVYDHHIHVDDDPSKPSCVMWVGESK